jgi:hypothetical protein
MAGFAVTTEDHPESALNGGWARDPDRESMRPVDAGLIAPVRADELSWQSNKQYVVVEIEAGPPTVGN